MNELQNLHEETSEVATTLDDMRHVLSHMADNILVLTKSQIEIHDTILRMLNIIQEHATDKLDKEISYRTRTIINTNAELQERIRTLEDKVLELGYWQKNA